MEHQSDSLTLRLVALPRLARIMIVVFFALMMVLLISPLVDFLYIRLFYTAETIILPSLITITCGCIMYILGWRIYVGTVDSIPSADKRVLLYFVVGLISTVIVVGLLVLGVAISSLPN